MPHIYVPSNTTYTKLYLRNDGLTDWDHTVSAAISEAEEEAANPTLFGKLCNRNAIHYLIDRAPKKYRPSLKAALAMLNRS